MDRERNRGRCGGGLGHAAIGEVWQDELRDAIRANSPILEYFVTAKIVAQPPRLRLLIRKRAACATLC